MVYELREHVRKLPMNAIQESVSVEPQESYTEEEVRTVLKDLANAVKTSSYVPATPTEDKPALSDDYVFDAEDEKAILRDLTMENFVGKALDVGKGAKGRLARGLPQEYLYIFKYPCVLYRRDADGKDNSTENILVYIKLNDRKVPYEKVFVVSFHKNKPKKKLASN